MQQTQQDVVLKQQKIICRKCTELGFQMVETMGSINICSELCFPLDRIFESILLCTFKKFWTILETTLPETGVNHDV